MSSNQQQKTGERAADHRQEGEKLKVEGRESQLSNPESLALPPSASSSPAHEFSFTISLHSASADKAKSTTPASFAIDLSPADDIFFHGHLLPLHLLSHFPSSARSSTNSMDGFTIPIKEIWDNEEPNKDTTNNCTTTTSNSNRKNKLHEIGANVTSGRSKSKPFSLFGFSKWRKGYEIAEQEDKAKQKRKLGFDVGQVLKRYARVVRPLLSFRWRKENMEIHRQAYSFSGNLSLKNKQELRGRRGEFSAPASMRTSPTNSGLLVATPSLSSSTSDSTMEELQAAIQAAIAHCKNSIAKEENTIVKS